MNYSIREQFQRLRSVLATPIDNSTLALFRIFYGALLAWETVRFYPRIQERYLASQFNFTYCFAPFVRPWSETGFEFHFALMFLAAVGVTLGLFFRTSTFLLLLTYTYLFLLDQTEYNNHYYLCVLLTFLLLTTKANASWSLDALFNRKLASTTVPFWQIGILRLQFVLVYFFAGVAKMNPDWMRAEPMRDMLYSRAAHPLIGSILKIPYVEYFFAYGGLVFDTLIGFVLLHPRTRMLGVVVLVFFHLMNNTIFSIGIFPFLGIASVVIFFEPDTPRAWLEVFLRKRPWRELFHASPAIETKIETAKPASGSVPMAFILSYFAVQFFLPIRHFLFYEHNPSWTEEGHNFAWHMKLRSKSSYLSLLVFDEDNPERGYFLPELVKAKLTSRQWSKMGHRPHLIAQYANYIRELYEAHGMPNVRVHAEAIASLNGRPFQYLIDPRVDIGSVSFCTPAPANWIMPLNPGEPGGNYTSSYEERMAHIAKARKETGDYFGFGDSDPTYYEPRTIDPEEAGL